MCRERLLQISIGEYESPLSFKGKTSQASIIGGVVSLVVTIILLIATFFILSDIFAAKHFNLDEETINVNWQDCCDSKGEPYNFYNETN